MRLVKLLSVVTVLAGLIAVAIVAAPSVAGQAPRLPVPNPPPNVNPRVDVFPGGARIGASVRDLEAAERREGGGVYVDEVTPGSPAEKAGLRPADIITRFDGEPVRSAMQFSRLVQETPAGRAVSATVLRDGKPTDLSVTPEPGPTGGIYIDRDRIVGSFDRRRLEEQMERLEDRLRNLPYDFDFSISGAGRAQLGVTVEELTPQLATYFGAKDGVLVSSVADDSPASRAGLRAGDVIHSVNGARVTSRSELVRALRSAGTNTDVTIGFVRDKKESSVTAKIEGVRPPRPPRPVRPVRATPA